MTSESDVASEHLGITFIYRFVAAGISTVFYCRQPTVLLACAFYCVYAFLVVCSVGCAFVDPFGDDCGLKVIVRRLLVAGNVALHQWLVFKAVSPPMMLAFLFAATVYMARACLLGSSEGKDFANAYMVVHAMTALLNTILVGLAMLYAVSVWVRRGHARVLLVTRQGLMQALPASVHRPPRFRLDSVFPDVVGQGRLAALTAGDLDSANSSANHASLSAQDLQDEPGEVLPGASRSDVGGTLGGLSVEDDNYSKAPSVSSLDYLFGPLEDSPFSSDELRRERSRFRAWDMENAALATVSALPLHTQTRMKCYWYKRYLASTAVRDSFLEDEQHLLRARRDGLLRMQIVEAQQDRERERLSFCIFRFYHDADKLHGASSVKLPLQALAIIASFAFKNRNR